MARQIDVLFSHLHNHPHHQNEYSHWERNSEFRERWNTGVVDNYAKQIIKGHVSGGKYRECGVSVSSLPPTNSNTETYNIDNMKLTAVTLTQQ